jgi:hypothetical protein
MAAPNVVINLIANKAYTKLSENIRAQSQATQDALSGFSTELKLEGVEFDIGRRRLADQVDIGDAPLPTKFDRQDDKWTTPPPGEDIPFAEWLFPLYEIAREQGAATDDTYDRMAGLFTDLISAHFPEVPTQSAVAEAWMTRALSEGGTAVDANVEDQAWSRARSAALRQAQQESEKATAEWAARGFSMPPGGLVHQMAAIDTEARRVIADASRKVATGAAAAELKNVRLAVERAFAARQEAVVSAIEYMRAVALAPDHGLKVTQNLQDVHKRVNDTVMELHNADIAAREHIFGVRTADHKFRQDKNVAEVGWKDKQRKERAAALTALIKSFGSELGAVLGGMHARGSVSGSDTTQIDL